MARRVRGTSNRNQQPAGNADDIANVVADIGDNGSADDDAIAAIDVATVEGSGEQFNGEADRPTGRRRGRPPGSGGGGGKQKAKTLPLNVTGLEKLLVGIHTGLAVVSRRTEWALDTTPSDAFDGKSESAYYATACADVAKHYGGELFDQKTVDWLNLIQCLALIYGSRIIAIRMTPKIAPKPKAPTVQEAAKHFASPANTHNGDASRVHIEGIGDVQLPDDNPLSPDYKPRVN